MNHSMQGVENSTNTKAWEKIFDSTKSFKNDVKNL